MPEISSPVSRSFTQRLGVLYLGYIAILLPIAGFFLVNVLHVFTMSLSAMMIGGAAIGIVSASATVYTVLPSSPWKMLFLLLDGPLWALLGQHAGKSFSVSVVHTAIIESIAILSGMLLVVLLSRKSVTGKQRTGASIALGIPLLGVGILLARILQDSTAFTTTVVLTGILQSIIAQYILTKTDRVLRDATPYILVAEIGWIAAVIGTGAWEAFHGA